MMGFVADVTRRRRTGSSALGAVVVIVVVHCGGQQIDNTVCTPDETLCGNSCAALNKDPQNCGACGTVCGAGTVCFDGACATSCGGGTIQCGQSCVDPHVDRDNCGGCGVSCPSGEACVAGACSSSCAGGQTLCALDGGAYCANTQSDNANCGGCGVTCGPEEVCANGTCASQCAPNQTLCTPQNASAYCTDVTTDVQNCGGCGLTCSAHAYCGDGACACEPGYTMCSTACVDLTADVSNCGACGAVCNGTCAEGRCLETLATSSCGARAVVLDGTNVYWADHFDGSWCMYAHQVPKAGGTPITLGYNSVLGISVLSVDANYVYWPTGGNQVTFVPIGGGTLLYESLPGFYCGGLTNDGTDVFVGNNASIYEFPVGGGTATEIVPPYHTGIQDLTAADLFLYWFENTTIERVQKDGTGLMTVADVASGIQSLTVYGANVYFAVVNGEVLSAPVDGSSLPLVLYSGGTYAKYAIATDGTYVYWVDQLDQTLSKVPLGGGPTTTLTTSTGPDVWQVAVDGTSVYWGNATGVMKLTPK